jgi:hypothetical protein
MLVPFEWGLKLILEEDSTSFFGPTIAAAGLSFMVPLTEPKRRRALPNGEIVISPNDNRFIPILWILIILSLFAWAASCYFSLKLPSVTLLSLPCHLAIGVVVYALSIVLTYVKRIVA